MRAQDLRQRLERCEAQLAALREETSLYREAMRTAPQQVQTFLLGIQRQAMRTAPQQVQTFLLGIQHRQQAEQQLNRAQRRQRARGQER